jgi:hypothetical protein
VHAHWTNQLEDGLLLVGVSLLVPNSTAGVYSTCTVDLHVLYLCVHYIGHSHLADKVYNGRSLQNAPGFIYCIDSSSTSERSRAMHGSYVVLVVYCLSLS